MVIKALMKHPFLLMEHIMRESLPLYSLYFISFSELSMNMKSKKSFSNNQIQNFKITIQIM